jgi:hypothetical protein
MLSAVSQTCSLLCSRRKGRAGSVVTFGSPDAAFGELLVFGVASQSAAALIIASLADCKSAIQQTACLRYVRDPRSERPTLLIAPKAPKKRGSIRG